MAKNPCVINYKGKEYSYGDFMAYLASGEFDNLIQEGVVSEKIFRGDIPFVRQGREPEIKERGFITSIKASPDISDAVKRAFSASRTIYESLPNTTTIIESNAIIDAMGEAEAKAFVLSPTSQMPAAFRVGVAQILIKRYNAMGDVRSSVEVAEGIGEMATDWGQGIQALSLFSLLTPEGQLMAAQRDIEKQRDRKIRNIRTQKKITELENGLKKEQKEAASEVANKYSGKSPQTTIPSKPQRPKTYGSKNKAVTSEEYERARQALINKIKGDSEDIQPSTTRDNLPVPDEVFTIAMYHYEANSGNKEAFTKALLEDLGQGMEAYASDIFDIAQKEVDDKIKSDKVKDLTEKLEKMMEPKAPSVPTQGKTKAERMTELAAEIDALEGGSFYQNMVAQQLADQKAKADQERVEGLIDKLKNLISPKAPSTPVQGKTKEERMMELAAEIDSATGGTFHQDLVAQEIADQQAEIDRKKAERQAESDQKKAERQAESDRKKAERQAEIDRKKAERAAEMARREAQRKADVAARKASRQAAAAQRKAQRQAQVQARQAQRQLDAKIKKAKSPRGITETLKGMGTDMNKLIRSHFESQEATREALVNKLVQSTGLTGQQAVDLAQEITDEFNRIATERKKKFLDRNLPKKKVSEQKDEVQKLIEKTNAGVLDRADFEEVFADIMGFPPRELSQEEKDTITALTKAVEEARTIREKDRATIELLKARERIKGYSMADAAQAAWMANVLSGPRTQIVNIIANVFNTVSELGVGSLRDPRSIRLLVTGLGVGIKRGLYEGADVLRTGQAPLRGKIEVPSTLENMETNPVRFLKYVRRFMLAADTVFYEGLKQMRYFQLAYKMALDEKRNFDPDSGLPPIDVRNRAIEILNRGESKKKEATDQARLDKEKRIQDVEDMFDDGEITRKEADRLIKLAKIDERFQIHEILEKDRPQEMVSKAHDYAARGTFNYKPEGLLGAVADSVNGLKRRYPAVGYVVPFVNVIANVANELLNYTPIGYARAYRTSGTTFGSKTERKLDDDMRADIKTKATMGLVSTIAVMLLSNIKDDEDEPLLEITANGTGDYQKNQILKNEKGWQEYSLRVKNPLTGEYTNWMSYRYTPLLLMFGFVGDLNDQKAYRSKDIDPDSSMLMATKAAGGVVRSFFEATFFPAISDFLQIVVDDKNQNFVENMKDWAIKTGTSFVIPNFYTQTTKYIDQFSKTPQKEVMGDAWSRVLVQLPVAKNDFNEKVNAFGEPIYQDMDLILSSEKKDESTKYWDLIIEKRASLSPPMYTQTLIDPATMQERSMTNDEFYKYSKIRGQYIKAMLKNNYDLVSTMNQEQFGSWLNGVKGDASNVAKTYTATPLDDTKNYWEQIEAQFLEEKIKKFIPIPVDVSIENLGTKTTERAEKILTPKEEEEE